MFDYSVGGKIPSQYQERANLMSTIQRLPRKEVLHLVDSTTRDENPAM